MKGFVKIIAAGLVLIVLAVAGCAALVGAGANEAAHAIKKSEQRDTNAARVFAPKFAKVRVGDSLTGHGGMSFAQVRGLLGKPQPGHVTESKSHGIQIVTWSYDFVLSNGSSLYSVEFVNGKVSSKDRM